MRVEVGDDPDRYADAEAHKHDSEMSQLTRASWARRVVLARWAGEQRLSDAPLHPGISPR